MRKLQRRQQCNALPKRLRLREGSLRTFEGVFGISGLCNILGAIKTAKYYHLGKGDVIATIATERGSS